MLQVYHNLHRGESQKNFCFGQLPDVFVLKAFETPLKSKQQFLSAH